MKLKYLGHSTFQLFTGGVTIIVDPFISGNPLAGDVSVDELEADFILVTHGHGDHVADVAAIAGRTGAPIISNYEIVEWFGKQGLQGYGMNHGGQLALDFGTLKYVNAVHSSTLPDGSSGGNPGGFVVWNDEGCIYFAGDTALTMDMQLIPRICPPLTAAVLPMGDFFTMGYADAVIAADFVKCDKVVACHYDTFPPITLDREAASGAFNQAGKELILMDINAEVELG